MVFSPSPTASVPPPLTKTLPTEPVPVSVALLTWTLPEESSSPLTARCPWLIVVGPL